MIQWSVLQLSKRNDLHHTYERCQISLEARTPSLVIPFPEYVDMLSPPHTGSSTILADASLFATPASDKIRIFESLKADIEPSRSSELGGRRRIYRDCVEDLSPWG